MADTKTQSGQNGTPPNGTPPNGTPPNTAMAVLEKNVSDMVFEKLKVFQETGSINIPKNYSAANAVRVGWLMVQEMKDKDSGKYVLELVTKNSVANAFLKMLVLGLNPYKRQGSFIRYGNELSFQKEYQGTIAIAKRHGVKNVSGCAVFKGDVFQFITIPKTGYHEITKHEQSIENLEKAIVEAAYATKEYEDGRCVTLVMAMSQIRKAWEQGPMKGNSPAHRNFPDEMAIKSVINRLLKPDVNSSDDSDLFDDEDGLVNGDDTKMANVKHQISEHANKNPVGFEDAESETVTDTKPEVKPVSAVLPVKAQEKEPVTADPGF